ncbi:hypothetical protein ACP275_09G145000 [Erythranthe tilingii]
MQLAQHDIRTANVSETEPILPHPSISDRSEESSSSIEITVGVDSSIAIHDPLVPEIDEGIALVRADQPQCRICLDSEGEDLIAPCHCKGTQKYVHRSCLDNWRSTKEGFAFAHCTECRAKFILRANVPPDRWWLRLKFQFLVARDHAVIFVIVQLVCWYTNFMEKSYGKCLVMKNIHTDFILWLFWRLCWWVCCMGSSLQ